MEKLPLRIACGRTDRMQALESGAVRAEGIALSFSPSAADCQVAEVSLSAYLSRRAGGDYPFLAIPVFPLRLFCHDLVRVNRQAGIAEARQLAGKRVGLVRRREDASLWIRHLLRQQYGVDSAALQARQGDAAELATMLAAGEIDACFGARLEASEAIGPLFADERAAARAYWHDTGVFPIVTTLVMREEFHGRHPWVAESLFKACEEAKRRCLREMRFSGALRLMLPWLLDELEESDALLGPDPWPYGVAANRTTLQAMAQMLEGEIPHKIDIDAMFAPIVAWAE